MFGYVASFFSVTQPRKLDHLECEFSPTQETRTAMKGMAAQRRADHRDPEARRGRIDDGGVMPTARDHGADLLPLEGELLAPTRKDRDTSENVGRVCRVLVYESAYDENRRGLFWIETGGVPAFFRDVQRDGVPTKQYFGTPKFRKLSKLKSKVGKARSAVIWLFALSAWRSLRVAIRSHWTGVGIRRTSRWWRCFFFGSTNTGWYVLS